MKDWLPQLPLYSIRNWWNKHVVWFRESHWVPWAEERPWARYLLAVPLFVAGLVAWGYGIFRIIKFIRRTTQKCDTLPPGGENVQDSKFE